MLKIYFKPTCSTCRTALSMMKENTKEEIEVVEYMKAHPTQKEIREILDMLGMKAEDLVRKKESLYKEKFAGKKLNNQEWIRTLCEYPELIERPIVVNGNKAILGRPPQKVLDIL